MKKNGMLFACTMISQSLAGFSSEWSNRRPQHADAAELALDQ